jgi:hypothetical protein
LVSVFWEWRALVTATQLTEAAALAVRARAAVELVRLPVLVVPAQAQLLVQVATVSPAVATAVMLPVATVEPALAAGTQGAEVVRLSLNPISSFQVPIRMLAA